MTQNQLLYLAKAGRFLSGSCFSSSPPPSSKLLFPPAFIELVLSIYLVCIFTLESTKKKQRIKSKPQNQEIPKRSQTDLNSPPKKKSQTHLDFQLKNPDPSTRLIKTKTPAPPTKKITHLQPKTHPLIS